MNLPARTAKRSASDIPPAPDLQNAMIWSFYFERDYIRMATDKIPPQKAGRRGLRRDCPTARPIGRPNLIVGRCDLQGRMVSTTATKW